jgi:hypothetical protein
MGQSSSDWRAEKRRAIEEVFASSTRGAAERHLSPSGRYDLEVVQWENERGWNYSEGSVVSGTGELIARIRRNYGSFPFTWCEDHPNGHDYLVAGEDYQGQTVIELDTGARVDHLTDAAQPGAGFCWARHYVTPDKSVLVVDGCVWACPYELVAFDFSDPLNLPYPELHRWVGDLRTIEGFDANGTLTWTTDEEVRLSDGKPYRDLTDEEEAELLDEAGKYIPGMLGERTYRARWRQGQPFESTEMTCLGDDG